MEEALKEAMLAAGNVLVEALRQELIQQGFDTDLSVRAEEDRVVVTSHSHGVWQAEIGDAGAPPKAPVTGVANRVASEVAGVVRDHLEGVWR